ncbi:putative peptidoglycan binding domain protein [[Clostridium] sordellii ATCC 9714]|nr:putative peptidoglycan binding domain protein [[Clostridium] sordellii ATCC 9714] [Paeniclostridium sordellii ATCC 9714]
MKRQKIYFLLIISVLFYLGQSNEVYAIGEEGKIYKNIYIENIDVSGLTKKEAIKKLNKEIYISDKINLIYDKNIYELKLKDINFNYKLEEAINNAYEFTRKDNFLQNIKTKFNLSFGKRRNLNLEPVFNDEKLDLYINNLCSNINIEPKNANIKVEKNQFNITNEINGISVDSKKLFELIKEELISKSYKDIQIPINIIYPEYNHENLSKINTVLGRFETEFNAKNLNRVNNIKVAVNNASNILLNSKKEFSFNEFIGKRSVDRGFKEAPVIVNGELTSGMGGGICQVSSTIYNSALYAGLEIVQLETIVFLVDIYQKEEMRLYLMEILI